MVGNITILCCCPWILENWLPQPECGPLGQYHLRLWGNRSFLQPHYLRNQGRSTSLNLLCKDWLICWSPENSWAGFLTELSVLYSLNSYLSNFLGFQKLSTALICRDTYLCISFMICNQENCIWECSTKL